MRDFYAAKFKAYVPPASGGPIGNCARYGACNIWENPANRPSSKEWNRYAWGTKTPQTYDMVVFPPTGGNAYGHIASVDHMAGAALYVMDANWSPWKGHKAGCVHSVGAYKPLGFYRLKALEPAPTAPPPKPVVTSCVKSAAGFTFSCDGTQAGLSCVNVDEPADPGSWKDDFYCSTLDIGMTWSSAGAKAGMDCTHVGDSATPSPWADDFLCVPKQAPFAFTFSENGEIAGKSCVQWDETDAPAWKDSYLCQAPVVDFEVPQFAFRGDGPDAAKSCVALDESGDPGWTGNALCSTIDVGMKWSAAGPIAGMTCTNLAMPNEKLAKVWSDNFLCLPADSSYTFTWSSAGPLADKSCVRFYDHDEASQGWLNAFLCIDGVTPTTAPGGPVTTIDTGSPDAGSDDTPGNPNATTPPAADDPTAPPSSSSGCAMASSSRTGGGEGIFAAFAVLGFALRARSRRAASRKKA